MHLMPLQLENVIILNVQYYLNQFFRFIKQIGKGEFMDIFNFIAGLASIVSLLISIFVANKVIKIKNLLNITNVDSSRNDNHQSIKTRDNRGTTINQYGRDHK
ncbi:hypothetical protein A9523_03765 [Bacillus cereus]|uniref:hypothetical protein n=1 Tax=Bacillus cereus TaxID=1396 RepID=UPI00084C1B12|nr:hypothetical protein [Bacillus cereus]OED21176.1 hypothetical protein A9523_03765 [Bacillus cereus]